MARYLVVEESIQGHAPVTHGPFDGLAVAKAVAQKVAAQAGHGVAVQNAESGEQLAYFEGQKPAEEHPSLARSVHRMRAANDRLKEALVPFAQSAREKK